MTSKSSFLVPAICCFSIAFSTLDKRSRNLAANSNSSSLLATCIRSVRSWTTSSVCPSKNRRRSRTNPSYSSSETSPTQGPAHCSMWKSRQGLPSARCSAILLSLHVRIGNVRNKRSRVSRIAWACPNGPKYRFPRFRFPRMTIARGHSSRRVTDRNG